MYQFVGVMSSYRDGDRMMKKGRMRKEMRKARMSKDVKKTKMKRAMSNEFHQFTHSYLCWKGQQRNGKLP